MSSITDKQQDSFIVGGFLLPETFVPSVNEVIIGRGQRVVNHPGNHRFRDLIESHQIAYSTANSRNQKTTTILTIVQEISGGFVKLQSRTKRWYKVEDSTARSTVAQALRDGLSGTYRSSKQFKRTKRLGSILEKKRDSVSLMAKSLFPAPMYTAQEATQMHRVKSQMAGENTGTSTTPGLHFGFDNLLSSMTAMNALRSNMSSFNGMHSSTEAPILAVSLDTLLSSWCMETSDPFEPVPISPSSPAASVDESPSVDDLLSTEDIPSHDLLLGDTGDDLILNEMTQFPDISFSRDTLIW